jgi:putative ABC transport system ATP-binding protein
MKPLVMEAVSQTRGRGARAVKVLHAISLAVEPGEFVLIEGPSGAGKTTLLSVAGGILTPEEGTVDLGGRRLHAGPAEQDRRHRARTVGFVFQRCNLIPHLTVWENIVMMGRIAGLRTGEIAREAETLLTRIGMLGLRARFPRELSGGEEQRAAVVRALVHRPAVVLADEPTGNLDSRAGQAVAESLSEMAGLCRSAVIVATHDTRLAAFASRVIRIEDGRIRA